MAEFHFKAKRESGEVVEGTREGDDKLTLATALRSEGLTPFLVEPASGSGARGFFIRLNALFQGVSLHEKIIFARNLAAMISAGLSLSRAIEILEKQTTNVTFKKVLAELTAEIGRGGTLSAGLKKFPKVFPPIFVAMVRAGEESGGLAGALKEVSVHLEKNYILIKKVRGAMMYPAIILIAIVIIGALMLIYVVPTLTITFKELNVELPASTKFVILVSDLLTAYTFQTLAGLIIFIFLFTMALRTKLGARYFDFSLLRLPVIGNIVKEINAARTTRTLSSLLTAGVAVTEAITITRDVLQNSYYRAALESAAQRIQKGAPIAEVFREETFLFPVMVGEMIEVGEETGKLSDMLLNIATFYEEEVENATKDLSTIIEPVLMVVIGAAVGFFAISMISPTYSLLNNI